MRIVQTKQNVIRPSVKELADSMMHKAYTQTRDGKEVYLLNLGVFSDDQQIRYEISLTEQELVEAIKWYHQCLIEQRSGQGFKILSDLEMQAIANEQPT